jgi:hypothetical protein
MLVPGLVEDGRGHDQMQLFRRRLISRQPPQVHRQPSRGGDRTLSSGRTAGHARDQGPDRWIVGLPPGQPPDQFDEQRPHPRVAVTVDRAVAFAAAALLHSGTQPGVTGDLTAVLEPTPITDLAQQDDPGQGTDRLR